jgi:hypothetical protein
MAAELPSSTDTTTRLAPVVTRPDDLVRELQALGARAAQLEERVEREQRGVDARLRQLEGQVSPAPAARPWYARLPWDKIPPLLQAITTPLMVVLVGWWLTGRLDLAIKQQQADIAGVKEMREALKDLYAAEPEKSLVETAALSMAAFGGVAAGPLVEALNLGGAARSAAAERALIAAAALDKERVCDVLASVAGSTEALYAEETRNVAERLRRELRC